MIHTAIEIPRTQPYDWHGMFGLTPSAVVETDTRAEKIQFVSLTTAPLLECRKEDGSCMTGIEVLERFNTVEWIRYRPLDAAFYAACRGRKGILSALGVRAGVKRPYVFLDSTVFGSVFQDARIRGELSIFGEVPRALPLKNVLGPHACTLMLYEDCDGLCRHQLVPLSLLRCPDAFVLAMG